MRVAQILGVILIAAGLFVLIKSPSYTSEKNVVKLGSLEANVEQSHAIPPWAGGIAIGAGVLLFIGGFKKPG
jgi:hypothetical protein